MLEDCVKYPYFIDGWFSTLVPDARKSDEGEECKVKLPQHGLVEHQEAERSVAHEHPGPGVIRSVESGVDLVQVVGGSESPLLEVVLEEEAAVGELGGVSLGFVLFLPVGSVDVGSILHINIVKTLRWSESQVVVSWLCCLSEVSNRGIEKTCHFLYINGYINSYLRFLHEQFS
jgi:hypothetical protein